MLNTFPSSTCNKKYTNKNVMSRKIQLNSMKKEKYILIRWDIFIIQSSWDDVIRTPLMVARAKNFTYGTEYFILEQ